MSRQCVAAEYSSLVTFVRAGEGSTEFRNAESKTKNADKIKEKVNVVSGDEAKQFYEETLAIQTQKFPEAKLQAASEVKYDDSAAKRPMKQRKQPTGKCSTKVSVNDCLKIAQNGDEERMKKLLLRGADITQVDNFGWDALMCAAHNGHLGVVRLLLKKGANKFQCDSRGRTAASLAGLNGHIGVQNYIKNFNQNSYYNLREQKEVSKTTITHDKFYCPVCKSHFQDSSVKEHEVSTVHLFNLKLKPKEDPFVIPSSNVGYKLMMKSGWDGQKGLGAESQGKRHPIKTVLKRDRACLGSEAHSAKKAKVTHFGPNDTCAVKKTTMNLDRKMSAKTLSKKAQKFREKKAKNWERNLRQCMNMD